MYKTFLAASLATAVMVGSAHAQTPNKDPMSPRMGQGGMTTGQGNMGSSAGTMQPKMKKTKMKKKKTMQKGMMRQSM